MRHSGHLLEWSVVRAKQARQYECPHGVVTGSNSRLEHRLHSTSSDCSTMRALSHIPRLSVPEPQQAFTRMFGIGNPRYATSQPAYETMLL